MAQARATHPNTAAPMGAQKPATPVKPAPPGATGNPKMGGYSQTISPGSIPQDTAAADDATGEPIGETDIDAIRQEGLTGRQLRMARRLAQKHGLAPISDFDAVRLLRLKGVDPFQRSNMLELVVPPSVSGKLPAKDDASGRVQLPQTVHPDDGLPSTELSPAQRRNNEIADIQLDITKRRRKRLLLLLSRLTAFVFLPTILAGWYYFSVATPMYATKSEFLILQADNQGGSALGGLLPTQYATSQDSIAVQAFLKSKDAMLRLEKDYGYKAHFSQEWIDPIQRLSDNPSNEAAYKIYKKNVKIGYDPTEGVIRMEVIAADPVVSQKFAQALISYAEHRIDDLSRNKRDDAMRTAQEGLETAKSERRSAQEALVKIQETQGVDPTEQLAVLRQQIGTYQMQLQEKQLQLQALLDNSRPNRAKVDGARGDVRRLEALLKTLNSQMSEATTGKFSLASQAARIQMAQADLVTADMFLQNALLSQRQTAVEASRQVRYLTVPVPPIAAEDPSYPRSFENTILAFLIFSGMYLLFSLTSSILREQVSS